MTRQSRFLASCYLPLAASRNKRRGATRSRHPENKAIINAIINKSTDPLQKSLGPALGA